MKKIVEKRADIVFFLKLFVIVSQDPKAVKNVVCNDSLAVLEDAYEHKAVPEKDCPTKELEDNRAFAQANGISAAPALVFPGGAVQIGYSGAAELEKSIDEATKRQHGAAAARAAGEQGPPAK
jgi:protein-disulfide isomerase